jgi:hypothetical protein
MTRMRLSVGAEQVGLVGSRCYFIHRLAVHDAGEVEVAEIARQEWGISTARHCILQVTGAHQSLPTPLLIAAIPAYEAMRLEEHRYR